MFIPSCIALAAMKGLKHRDEPLLYEDALRRMEGEGGPEPKEIPFTDPRQQEYELALREKAKQDLEEQRKAQAELDRQEAAQLAQNKDDLFQDALDAAQAAKYSPGRQIANLITPAQVEGSGFFYRAVSGTFDAAYRILADPLLVAGKAKRLIDISRYSVDVVVGGDKVAEVFARPQVQNFWNSYGADLAAYKKAIDTGATKEAVAIKQRLTTLAPEFGDPVIKSFINSADDAVPITDALSAKAFFENAKQLEEMMKGQIGRKRARGLIDRNIRGIGCINGRRRS